MTQDYRIFREYVAAAADNEPESVEIYLNNLDDPEFVRMADAFNQVIKSERD